MGRDFETIKGLYEIITDDRDFLVESRDWELEVDNSASSYFSAHRTL